MERRNYSRDLRLAEWGLTVILRSNHPQDRMSALGKSGQSHWGHTMSALPAKADIVQHGGNVRFVPIGDIAAASAAVLAGSKKSSHQETGAALQFRAS